MKYYFNNSILIIIFLMIISISCSTTSTKIKENTTKTELAKVVSVTTTGKENSYTINIGIKSPDTGCKQYANWWEIVSEDQKLIYRRILGHSHVNEQPFIRSGRRIAITKNQIVIIRAHMNTTGYGTKVFKGSIAKGFIPYITTDDFATALAKEAPLPKGCLF